MNKVVKYEDILRDDEITSILNLEKVIKAKEEIEKRNEGSVYFSIKLTSGIKESIQEKLGLNVIEMEEIPMRWIKGDSRPHIDRGSSNFKNTYLMYLTDNEGDLIVENERYPITRGLGYVFNEGLCHETKNTGIEPRLLI